MVGRKRQIGGREAGPAEVGELLGMELDRETQLLGAVEDAAHLFDRKRDALAEAVDGIDQTFGMRLLEAGQHDIGDVIAIAALVFDWRRMGAEIGGDDADRAKIAESAGGAQHLQLGFDVEPIAGLDLDRRHPLGKQRVETRKRCGDEAVDGQRVGGLDRRDDTAASAGDLFIGGAIQPHLELAGAVAAMDDVGVAIDETRRHPAAFEIGDLGALDRQDRQFAFRADIGDAAGFDDDRALLDNTQALLGRIERCQAGVAPQVRPSLSRGLPVWKIVPVHQLCAFPYASTCIYIINR